MNSNRKPRPPVPGPQKSRGTAPRATGGGGPSRPRPRPAEDVSLSTGHPEGERLQKIIAAAGVASRRVAEDMITEGRVRVDGKVVKVLGTRVDPTVARIEVDGTRIVAGRPHSYVLMNKPAGVITTASDPQGRPTVLSLVGSERRLFPVGRLDVDTTGVLLLTTDGELAHRMAHPKFQMERVYVAEVQGAPEANLVKKLTRGVALEDGEARALRARALDKGKLTARFEVVMGEGRKREIRRMFEKLGHPVVRLARIRFGDLSVRDLRTGQFRELDPVEVGELLRSVGL